ncbi:MAG: hypothetical protein ABFS56_08960 [Pseudomonadota bacterium]
MMTVEEITTAVTHLPPEDFALFRAWYDKFEASLWDSQIEEDLVSGKLDKLANEAIKDFKTNRCTEL